MIPTADYAFHKRMLVGVMSLLAVSTIASLSLYQPISIDNPDKLISVPSPYREDGRYTEFHIKSSILPILTKNEKFPNKISNDVEITKITAGPGSTINYYYNISPNFAKVHSTSDVKKYICQNTQLRNKIVSKLDSYNFVYFQGDKYLYTVKVTEASCKSLASY